MAGDQTKLDLLWKRVEDARLQWKSARQNAKEVQEDRLSGGLPAADGSYAHLHALRDQRLAVEHYLHALQEFKGALALERSPEEPPEEKPAVGTTNGSNGQEAITPREREVLALIAAGKSSKQIATHLGIAFRTAVSHRYHLYRKLNIHTNVELTRAAMRMGLIDL